MASESSSAVLDLNDDHTEDTDAQSVTEGTQDASPLIMEHGYDIAVKVDAPVKQLSTLETFVTYRVRCVCARWPSPPFVRRRYNHFKVLHKRLSAAHPWLAVPPLPPLHSPRQQLDRYEPSFVLVRALALHSFLNRVAKHPILTHSDDFRLFLVTPDEDLDKVFKSESSALNLWGLSSLYGGGEAKPANGARVKDPEFSAAGEYLQYLQQKLTALCAVTTKLYKGTSSLGTELVGLKRVCDAWSVRERGRAGCAAAALGAGGGAAGAARGGGAAGAARGGGAAGAARGGGAAGAARGGGGGAAPLAHRATLPALAAYAAAHAEKIRLRDTLHASFVAGNNSDELHNRLEQASEAIRSELSDWMPKTRSEIKALLLELADRQVTIHSQTLQGWERALKLSTETSPEQVFKTVSKTAVQNLSPSKCRSLTPTTEKDFDDLDIENFSNDSEEEKPADVDVSSERNSKERTDPLQEFSEVNLSM